MIYPKELGMELMIICIVFWFEVYRFPLHMRRLLGYIKDTNYVYVWSFTGTGWMYISSSGEISEPDRCFTISCLLYGHIKCLDIFSIRNVS